MTDSSSGTGLTEWLRRVVTVPPPGDRGVDEDGRKGWVITFCVLASALLWFTSSMRETYQRTVEIPLRIVNLEEGAALTARPPETARVQVEAEGIQLLRLYYNPPAIPVDASQETFDLGVAASEAISGVRIESILPRSVSLQKDRRISKRVPVRSRVAVVPPAGHHIIGTPRLQPDSVTVTGARSVVSSITFWPTRRLQVQPDRDTVAVQVTFVDSLRQVVEIDAQTVLFTASVREFTEGRRTIAVRAAGAPPGQPVQFEPPSILVIYQVALEDFDAALEAEDFFAEVPFGEMRRDTSGSLIPSIRFPEGLRFREYRLEPPAVGYYFQELFD